MKEMEEKLLKKQKYDMMIILRKGKGRKKKRNFPQRINKGELWKTWS